MKKHITIIALALFSLATVFSGCKKDKQKYIVQYVLDNKMGIAHNEYYILSPCFKANITYTDVDGKSIELKDVTLPWQKEITVEAPFTAKIEGNFTYDENALPEEVSFVNVCGINTKRIEDEGFISHYGFENSMGTVGDRITFLNSVQFNPVFLTFSCQHTINNDLQ